LKDRFGGDQAEVTLVANATCGLSAALIGHGVRGAVVIPNFTFPATLDAVLSARCTPILCDVDPDSCEMDPDALEQICRSYAVAAVMPVRVYGFVRDFAPIIDVARAHGAPVVIDAASALGGGRIEVAEDVTEVVSMHATKSLGIGEGGAIFAHESRVEAMRKAVNFGLRADRRFDFGINGKMSEFSAAIGLAQLDHIESLIAGRRAMAAFYDDLLRSFADIRLPCRPGATAWSNYPVILPRGTDTEGFQNACHARGLQVRRYYWPTIQQGFTEPLDAGESLQVSSDLAERAVCLPLYPLVTAEEKAEIAEILMECLEPVKVG
jgi:dTDP-4-amino-4,6-dideoxygalactose transaminase